MSILERINKQTVSQGIFCIVAGERMSGKSTIAGTLPGKTLMIQADLLETGSQSAAQLAKQRGNHLDIITFSDLSDLLGIMKEIPATDYNNIYIDSISAITELKVREPSVLKKTKTDVWGAFREVSDSMEAFIELAKSISISSGKNVFMSVAMEAVLSKTTGEVVSLEAVLKGNATIKHIKKLCPIFITLREIMTADNIQLRQMVTKSVDVYPGRIDGLLDEYNPGILVPDLGVLINLVKGGV
jgi:hypothetical protein